jgi:hypothetical protein
MIPAMTGAALKTSRYYILLSLASAGRHELAVAREVLSPSEGQVRLLARCSTGAPEDLSDRGWIEEVADAGRPA